MTEKHRSVNNVLWRVLADRIRRGRGPDAARGPPVGHPCIISSITAFIETSVPWAVRLSWLKMPIHVHFFRRAILTRKLGQSDLVFGVGWGFISRSVG